MNKDNVINFPEVSLLEEAPIGEKIITKEEKSLIDRKRESIQKLSGYRGEVPSRNAIRQLPHLREGEIFWVEMDNKAYIVASISGKKITIKALDETASVSLGYSVFELNKGLVSKEPLLDWNDTEKITELTNKIENWFAELTSDEFYMLYGRDIHYVTILRIGAGLRARAAETLKECLSAVGDIISIDLSQLGEEPSIEIWIRTTDSKAELLYLLPYDRGIVTI